VFRPAWQRVFVLVAGPLANVVFAVVTMSGFFMAYGLADYRPVIGALKPGFPAADAGLAAGDEILAIDGSPVEIFRDLSDAVQDAAGRPVSYLVRSEGRPLRDVIVVPRPVEVETVFGKERRFQIGIQASSDPADRVVKKFGLDSGVAAGAREIWRIGKMTAIAVGNIVAGRIPLSTLSGPVKIAEVAHVAVALGGLQGFAALMAMISCSVGLINLLPVPVLDGGHLATIAVETVIGRRLSERAQEVLYRFGFACLGCLVILITANDLIGLLDR
jgi:regulator of sigma E protease